MTPGSKIANAIKKIQQAAKLQKNTAVKKTSVDEAIIYCMQYMYDSKRVDWNYYLNSSPEEMKTKRKSVQVLLNQLITQLKSFNIQDPYFHKLTDLLQGYRTHIYRAMESKNVEELTRLNDFEGDEDAMLFHHILAYLGSL